MGDNFEISDENNSRRKVDIGTSWVDFDKQMRFYFPDDSQRARRYEHLLKDCIERGALDGASFDFSPSAEVDLDLSDQRIEREISRFNGEGE